MNINSNAISLPAALFAALAVFTTGPVWSACDQPGSTLSKSACDDQRPQSPPSASQQQGKGDATAKAAAGKPGNSAGEAIIPEDDVWIDGNIVTE